MREKHWAYASTHPAHWTVAQYLGCAALLCAMAAWAARPPRRVHARTSWRTRVVGACGVASGFALRAMFATVFVWCVIGVVAPLGNGFVSFRTHQELPFTFDKPTDSRSTDEVWTRFEFASGFGGAQLDWRPPAVDELPTLIGTAHLDHRVGAWIPPEWTYTYTKPQLSIAFGIPQTHRLLIGAPAWAFTLATAIPLVLLWLLRIPERRRSRRLWRNPYACPKCGYDLRASRERCPECGLAVVVST